MTFAFGNLSLIPSILFLVSMSVIFVMANELSVSFLGESITAILHLRLDSPILLKK